jgi:hypothetical protein
MRNEAISSYYELYSYKFLFLVKKEAGCLSYGKAAERRKGERN